MSNTRPALNLKAAYERVKSQLHGLHKLKPYLYYAGTTADATPVDIGKLPVAEGETIGITVETLSTEYDQSGERGFHIRQALFYRDELDDVTLQGSVQTIGTDIEVTGGMDVTLEVDTTTQTIDIKVTGVAASNIKWRSKVSFVRFPSNNSDYGIEG